MKAKSEYPLRIFAVKRIGVTWIYAESGLHLLGRNKAPYFYTTNFNGAAHGDIRKAFPELSSAIDLHLSSIDGTPLYALENAWYHYAEGVDESGERVYYASKEDKTRREQEAENHLYSQYAKRMAQEYPEDFAAQQHVLRDIFDSVPWYKKQDYNSIAFNTAQEMKRDAKPTLRSIVPRDNAVLAGHLRITEAEAEAIPANLAKEQFNESYILPSILRWNMEAQSVIRFLESAIAPLPFKGKEEEGQTYFIDYTTFLSCFSRYETNTGHLVFERID